MKQMVEFVLDSIRAAKQEHAPETFVDIAKFLLGWLLLLGLALLAVFVAGKVVTGIRKVRAKRKKQAVNIYGDDSFWETLIEIVLTIFLE